MRLASELAFLHASSRCRKIPCWDKMAHLLVTFWLKLALVSLHIGSHNSQFCILWILLIVVGSSDALMAMNDDELKCSGACMPSTPCNSRF